MERSKKCIVCGNDFVAKSNKALYCSNACNVAEFRNRKKLQEEYISNNSANNSTNNKIYNELQHQLMEYIVFVGKNYVTTGHLNVILDELNEKKSQFNELSKIIENQKIDYNQLHKQLSKTQNELEELRYQVKVLNKEVERLNQLKTMETSTSNAGDIISPLLSGFLNKI